MTGKEEYEIKLFAEDHRASVISLWNKCGLVRSWNDPDKDISRKLTDRNGAFFVLVRDKAVVGSVMVSYDGHRGSIYYLAIDPDHQSLGLGKRLMNHCETFLLDLECPKINLFVRRGNEPVLKFYEQLGFAEDAAVPLGKRLIPDD